MCESSREEVPIYLASPIWLSSLDILSKMGFSKELKIGHEQFARTENEKRAQGPTRTMWEKQILDVLNEKQDFLYKIQEARVCLLWCNLKNVSFCYTVEPYVLSINREALVIQWLYRLALKWYYLLFYFIILQ